MIDPIPIHGIAIKVCPEMRGWKKAVRLGDVIHVSPAMFDLMKHANQGELTRLLATIEVIDLGKFGIIEQPMPLTIQWNE